MNFLLRTLPNSRLGAAAIASALLALPAAAQIAAAVAATPVPRAGAIAAKALAIPAAERPAPAVVLAPLDEDRLRQQDDAAGAGSPLRCGVLRPLAAIGADGGVWHLLDDGTWLWIFGVRSVGAQGLRLHLALTGAPLAGRIVVHDSTMGGETLGPLGLDGIDPEFGFYAPTLGGDVAFVECWVPDAADRPPLDLGFRVDGVVHQYRGTAALAAVPLAGASTLLPCHLDATCFPAWSAEANGVVRIDYVDPPGNYLCSASLLSRVPGDQTPLLLTAHHCGVGPAAAASMQATWFYQTAACNGAAPSFAAAKKTVGAVLLREAPLMDMRLLGLLAPPPTPATFLGWNVGLVWPEGALGTVIHHPLGSHKRLTVAQKIGETAASCVGAEAFEFIIPVGAGEIQPGSSGSPVFDAQHLVKGVTSCGSASPTCGGPDFAQFGRLDYAFPKFKPYLTPTDPVFVNSAFSGAATGSAASPFPKLMEGLFAVIAGRDLFVAAGSYPGAVTIGKPLTLKTSGGPVTIGG